MSDKGHFGSEKLSALHDVQSSTENGACLTGHESNYSGHGNKNSCNYRYQAHEQAKANGVIKGRLESYKSLLPKKEVETSAYDTKAGGKNPAYYCAFLPIPEPGDWDVEGPNRAVSRGAFNGTTVIPPKMNFTQDTWPYWNNAHHLIPKGTLKACINAESAPIPELIQQALLKAKYNVNHKINMLLMPQDREVAAILQMPRHIQLKDDDEPDLRAMCTDHPLYNQMVKTMEKGLQDVIANYREICAKAKSEADKEDHGVPDPTLDKSKLEELSRKLLDIILSGGDSAKRGASLDAMADRWAKRRRSS